MPVIQVPGGEEGGPGGLEEREDDDDDKQEMERKRRDEEDMQDSLVVLERIVIYFPFVPLATCLLPLQLLLPGSLEQREV